jgi:hypothetical protein
MDGRQLDQAGMLVLHDLVGAMLGEGLPSHGVKLRGDQNLLHLDTFFVNMKWVLLLSR